MHAWVHQYGKVSKATLTELDSFLLAQLPVLKECPTAAFGTLSARRFRAVPLTIIAEVVGGFVHASAPWHDGRSAYVEPQLEKLHEVNPVASLLCGEKLCRLRCRRCHCNEITCTKWVVWQCCSSARTRHVRLAQALQKYIWVIEARACKRLDAPGVGARFVRDHAAFM